jgi:D-cysteine desulfhydrase
VKRDDLSSFDISGNKVRKLEFLLAEALGSDFSGAQYDSVITIGGIQSNHARATAVASRQLGLDPFLILRGREQPEEVKLVGNLLFNRLVKADIRLVSPGTYARIGSVGLTEQLAEQLRQQGRRPYVIPVGGSNAVGMFGYMEAVEEIRQQCSALQTEFDHIVFACG